MAAVGSCLSKATPGIRPAWTTDTLEPMEGIAPRLRIMGQEDM